MSSKEQRDKKTNSKYQPPGKISAKGDEKPTAKRTNSEVSNDSMDNGAIQRQLDVVNENLLELRGDLKHMLKKDEVENLITSNISNILKELEQKTEDRILRMKKDIEEDMKAKIDTDIEKLVNIKTKGLEDKINSLEFDNNALKEKLDSSKSYYTQEIDRLKDKANENGRISREASKKANYNEQYSRKNNIKIMDIKEDGNETEALLSTKVIDILGDQGIKLESHQFVAIHRIPGGRGHAKPVLMKLRKLLVGAFVQETALFANPCPVDKLLPCILRRLFRLRIKGNHATNAVAMIGAAIFSHQTQRRHQDRRCYFSLHTQRRHHDRRCYFSLHTQRRHHDRRCYFSLHTQRRHHVLRCYFSLHTQRRHQDGRCLLSLHTQRPSTHNDVTTIGASTSAIAPNAVTTIGAATSACTHNAVTKMGAAYSASTHKAVTTIGAATSTIALNAVTTIDGATSASTPSPRLTVLHQPPHTTPSPRFTVLPQPPHTTPSPRSVLLLQPSHSTQLPRSALLLQLAHTTPSLRSALLLQPPHTTPSPRSALLL
ncbi:hypothetical protein MAR_028312 [Mya arenaria]|uniref:Uncharacterized protein n=1 Tax=Mya arenaria TaxID=6604 RepID=A0ABY7DDB1_MYAAR|nr:hypothetical protein MAR_028312 [Mya arenaria]